MSHKTTSFTLKIVTEFDATALRVAGWAPGELELIFFPGTLVVAYQAGTEADGSDPPNAETKNKWSRSSISYLF
jgi:hypothetical protein